MFCSKTEMYLLNVCWIKANRQTWGTSAMFHTRLSTASSFERSCSQVISCWFFLMCWLSLMWRRSLVSQEKAIKSSLIKLAYFQITWLINWDPSVYYTFYLTSCVFAEDDIISSKYIYPPPSKYIYPPFSKYIYPPSSLSHFFTNGCSSSNIS